MGRAHRSVFEHLGCRVVASCNRSEDGRNRAKQDGITRTYASIPELLEQEALDAVICSTSIFNNYAAALDTIPHGVPVLLEKPPGTSSEELQTLAELSQANDTLVMLATNRIWYSVLRNAVEELGGLEAIEIVDVQWSESPQHLRNRGFSEDQIASRNFTNSIHGLSLLQYLCGSINDFDVQKTQGANKFDWRMSLQGNSTRNVMGRFLSSWSSPLPWRLAIVSRRYQCVFEPLEECTCRDLSDRTCRVIEPNHYDRQFKPGLYLQAQAFLDAVDSKQVPDEASLENARAVFRYAAALTKGSLETT